MVVNFLIPAYTGEELPKVLKHTTHEGDPRMHGVIQTSTGDSSSLYASETQALQPIWHRMFIIALVGL